MKLITIKCPSCGAKLQINNLTKKTKCEYCDNEIILDDNTLNVKHLMAGQITEEQEFINAETNLNKLKNYQDSYNTYLSLSKRYVDRKEIWLGLLRSFTNDFTYKIDTPDFKKMYEKYWDNFKSLATEKEINEYNYKYEEYLNIKAEPITNIINNYTSDKCYVAVTILGGAFGIHKFMQGKIKLGILYLFTFGLFGIGWIIDIINECKKWPNSNQIKIPKYVFMVFCIILAITELSYSILASILYILCTLTLFDKLWSKLNINNKFIKIIVPIVLLIGALELGTKTIPQSLYGTWLPKNNNFQIKKIILSNNDNILYINNNELIGTTVYYKEIIYFNIDSEEYRLKYIETKNELCLLNKNDECQEYYYWVKENEEEVIN